MPKINFLFLPDFTKWGKNGFLFFAGFLGLTTPQAAAAYPPPPAIPAGDRQKIARRRSLLLLLHMGIPQWAYYTNAHTNYCVYYIGIICPKAIDKYSNGHYNRHIQNEGAPGSQPKQPGNAPTPASRPARRVYNIRQQLARDKATGRKGNEYEKI